MEHREFQERYQETIPDNPQHRTLIRQGGKAHTEGPNRFLDEQGADRYP